MLASASQSKRTWLEKTSRRAPIEIAGFILLLSATMLVLFREHTASFFWSTMSLAFVIGMVVIAVRNRSNSKIAWACFGILGLMIVSLISQRLAPAISTSRSIHVAAHQLQSEGEFKNSPIVFYGREPYGASLTIRQSETRVFEHDETRQLVEFLSENPTSIIVSSKDPMKVLRNDLPWTVLLEKCEGKRHLYVSRPLKAAVANASNKNDSSTTMR